MDALALLALQTDLALQLDWGADEALAELPVNRLQPLPVAAPPLMAPPALAPRPSVPAPVATPPRLAPTHPPSEFTAGTLDEWRAAIRAFTGCALHQTATHPVLAEGNPAAGLLVIGDPPVAEDDRSGRPFSGAAGIVLDRILAALGRTREDVMLAPLIPWRPPGNRPPTDAELAQCLPLLHRLIVLCAPRHIVLTGILPVRTLLGSTTSLRRLRGNWVDLRVPGLDTPIPTLPSFSLANLKTAAERRDVWQDWRLLHRSIRTPQP